MLRLCLYFCSINVFLLLTSPTALSVFFLKSHVTPGTAAFTCALQTQRQKYVDAEWSGYHVSTQCSFQPFLACVASISVRFRSKERGARVKDRESKRAGRGWRRKEGNPVSFLPLPSPLFNLLALVPFLPRPKPKIPFFGLSLLRNQTETLATQAKPFLAEQSTPWDLLRTLRRKRRHKYWSGMIMKPVGLINMFLLGFLDLTVHNVRWHSYHFQLTN